MFRSLVTLFIFSVFSVHGSPTDALNLDDCSICLRNFIDNSFNVFQTEPCEHLFHERCFTKYAHSLNPAINYKVEDIDIIKDDEPMKCVLCRSVIKNLIDLKKQEKVDPSELKRKIIHGVSTDDKESLFEVSPEIRLTFDFKKRKAQRDMNWEAMATALNNQRVRLSEIENHIRNSQVTYSDKDRLRKEKVAIEGILEKYKPFDDQLKEVQGRILEMVGPDYALRHKDLTLQENTKQLKKRRQLKQEIAQRLAMLNKAETEEK